MFHILLAEDGANLRHVVEKTLRNAGYTVAGAEDSRAVWDMFCHERFDLVITDVMMPCMDGNALIAVVRGQSRDTPVLMLTALEAIDGKEKGFTSGADDYLVKPFELRELLLRVKALLRRYQAVSESRIVLPHTELDDQTNTARINVAEVPLTRKEFLLLFKLLSSPNMIFSREQLMNEIWGDDSESGDRTVDTHIKWFRDKAENPDFRIMTVRGLGLNVAVQVKWNGDSAEGVVAERIAGGYLLILSDEKAPCLGSAKVFSDGTLIGSGTLEIHAPPLLLSAKTSRKGAALTEFAR